MSLITPCGRSGVPGMLERVRSRTAAFAHNAGADHVHGYNARQAAISISEQEPNIVLKMSGGFLSREILSDTGPLEKIN